MTAPTLTKSDHDSDEGIYDWQLFSLSIKTRPVLAVTNQLSCPLSLINCATGPGPRPHNQQICGKSQRLQDLFLQRFKCCELGKKLGLTSRPFFVFPRVAANKK